jgi:hypothetical protein
MMTYAVAAMAVMMLLESWCLWRVLERLGVLDRFEDRLANLSHTLMLLTDTTETCFQVVANQLEKEQSTRPSPATRASRQRRIVSAAKRGRSMAEIASAEDVAESEARLRVQLSREQPEGTARGSMLT